MGCRVCLVKEEYTGKPIVINTARAAYELVREELSSSDREMLLSILLNTKLQLIGVETVSIGNLNMCLTSPAEIFKSAILANANSIILAHNHPSGDANPSEQDVEFTKRMIKAGMLMNIRVMDHIIVAAKGYVSLSDKSLIRL